METRDDILALAASFGGLSPVGIDESDILGSCGLEGDDADEFFEAFATKFSVKLDEFLHYFHYNGDEPPGGLRACRALDAGGDIIPYIPVSLDDLVNATEMGILRFDYPNHTARRVFDGSIWLFAIRVGLFGLVVVAALQIIQLLF